jgi:Zn-dependent protease
LPFRFFSFAAFSGDALAECAGGENHTRLFDYRVCIEPAPLPGRPVECLPDGIFLCPDAYFSGKSMDAVVSFAAIVAGVFLFIYTVNLIVVSSRLVKMQFWDPVSTAVVREAAGDELPCLDAGRAVLEQAGFVYDSTRRVRSLIASLIVPAQHIETYYHGAHGLRAELSVASFPTPHAPFAVSLWSTFDDGSALLTVSGIAHGLITFPRHITIVDAFAPDFPAQLAHHLKERERFSAPRNDVASMPAFFAALENTMLAQMVSEGKGYRSGELDGYPVYGIRLFSAVKTAFQLFVGMKKVKRAAKLREAKDAAPEAAPAARHAAERLAFVLALSTLHSLRAPRWFRWSAFVVSAAAFVALGTWWWGIAVALVIAAVVVVHEAGHWLAMRLAGFRDVQVFFVPGLGAATSGEKNDAHPLTHLAVFLAGPAPGLFMSLGAFIWLMLAKVDTDAWWFSSLAIGVFSTFLINLLNLAPVMPLDGGRVIDLFVMGRFPWIRFIFALISGVLLSWTGFTTGDNVLIVLGLVMLMAVPHHFRMARLSRDFLRHAVQAQAPSERFVDAAERLHDFLARPEYKGWKFDMKVGVAHTILPRFLGRLPSMKETVFGLLVYLACIAVPVGVVLAFAVKSPARFAAVVPFASGLVASITGDARKAPGASLQAENDARLAAVTDPQRHTTLLQEMIEEARDEYAPDEELRLARLLYAKTVLLPGPSLQHAKGALEMSIALRMAHGKGLAAESPRMLKEAESILRERLSQHDSDEDALLLARVLGEREASASAKANIDNETEIVNLHAAHWQASNYNLMNARISLAKVLEEAGRQSDAEKQLQIAGDDMQRLPRNKLIEYESGDLALNHAWFLMSAQRPQDAVTRLAPFLATPIIESPGEYSHERNAYLLAAIAARSQGDWPQVKTWATALYKFERQGSAGWLERTFGVGTPTVRYDLRGGLLLAEAQRHLGKGANADKLVAAMRPQFDQKARGKNTCHIGERYYETWRLPLQDAMRENEKREFQCEEPPPPLKCSVPAELPED